MHADNVAIAGRLREAAELLRAQHATPYRVNAYRDAASSVEGFPRSLRAVYDAEGVKGLDGIPRVGLGIASAIAEMLVRNRWPMLDQLRGTSDPATLLHTVPGIGARLAEQIHAELNIESLEQLQAAANDGRLASLPGVGARRAAAVGACVAGMLGRPLEEQPAPQAQANEPPVATLLDVDLEYRRGAARGELPLIAPRRPTMESATWLPVLHTTRGPWQLTAIYSNTALAQRLGRIHDWVVIHFYDRDQVERNRTVVTEHAGPRAGRRVVRGREEEGSHALPHHRTAHRVRGARSRELRPAVAA